MSYFYAVLHFSCNISFLEFKKFSEVFASDMEDLAVSSLKISGSLKTPNNQVNIVC